MFYPTQAGSPRTNESFRSRTQPQHHKERSFLEELDIDMMASFPICDVLHLIHLGIVKKKVLRWIGKTKERYPNKWKKPVIELVTRKLLLHKKHMPTDIKRGIRGLDLVCFWKGAEFKTFLMYVGIAVLQPILNAEEYEHFLTLFCAVTICSCDIYKSLLPLANDLFAIYVRDYARLYGESSVGSNVHNLLHVTADMAQNNIGNLNRISTYKFENYLGLLGMNVQSCNKPLQQAVNRLIEASNIMKETIEDNFSPFGELPFKSNTNMFKKINITRDIFLSNKTKNQWFLTHCGAIVKMNHAVKIGEKYMIRGFTLLQKCSYFNKPLNSSKFNIFQSNGQVRNELQTYALDSVKAKMVRLELNDDQILCIPLLHTLDELKK